MSGRPLRSIRGYEWPLEGVNSVVVSSRRGGRWRTRTSDLPGVNRTLLPSELTAHAVRRGHARQRYEAPAASVKRRVVGDGPVDQCRLLPLDNASELVGGALEADDRIAEEIDAALDLVRIGGGRSVADSGLEESCGGLQHLERLNEVGETRRHGLGRRQRSQFLKVDDPSAALGDD